MKHKKITITTEKNGPLIIENLKKMTNSRDELIEIKTKTDICRCGASKNKPFCDETHIFTKFNDEKSEDRLKSKRVAYIGKNITINDDRGICSHAGFCTDNLPNVFNNGKEPWIDPDGETIEEIKRVIKMCPSGALSYTENGIEYNSFNSEPEIHIEKNGPYYVRGNIEMDNEEMEEKASTEHYTLCRCGKSGNKPRCDGSHWYAAFKDDEALTISNANRFYEKIEPVWVKVASENEVAINSTKKLSIENQQILLLNVDGQFSALEGLCPHQGGPIIDASIENGIIRCPWHGHPFNPLTGKSLGDDSDLKTFEIEKRVDGIYIKVPPLNITKWSISNVVAETMVNWGITHVFGMVGHSNLGMAEAIRILEEKGKLKYIGVRYEGAAAFACSAYGKVTGKPAACLTIAGPGATNLLTGLWDAHVDNAPVLAITGQINEQYFGTGAFQEIDLKAAFKSVAPFSKLVLPNSNYAEITSLALKNAIVQKTVAHLIVPNDVQTIDAGNTGPGSPNGRIASIKITPPIEEVNLAMYRIFKTKKPAIIVGYGARNNMKEIIDFAETLKAPILTTFKAKGQISDSHPLATGVLGRSGTPVSSYFMNNADLLIVFGASFSQHTGIDRTKPIIQVDNDRMALAKFHTIDNLLWGDVGITAEIFKTMLNGRTTSLITEQKIAKHKELWKKEKDDLSNIDNGKGMNSAYIFKELNKLVPDNSLICVDVGNNAYSFGKYFECKNQKVILSGYLGSIGFSFPAAIGAFYAQSERPVISISGDGGFAQYMADFNTAVKYNMNITHILLNNNELAKISKEQREESLHVWETELTNPNFAKYAENCGGFGIRITKKDDLIEGIKLALGYNGPSILEIITDPILT